MIEFEAKKYMSFHIFIFVWVIRIAKQVYKNAGIYLWKKGLAKEDFDSKASGRYPSSATPPGYDVFKYKLK